MMFAAFVYDDYYCHGIKNSFAGLFREKEVLLQYVRGGRHGVRSNLEIMDLETAGIERYSWLPLYEYHQKYDQEAPGGTKQWLTHRFRKEAPAIALEWDGDVRRYGDNQALYDYGEWTYFPTE